MNDSQIRVVLKDLFLEKYRFDSDIYVFEEVGICEGKTIADIAVVNGHLSGYEIKSDVDSLVRLPQQITNYNRVFNEMYIVTSKKFAAKIKEYVPKWWGILEVKETVRGHKLIKKRASKKNSKLDVKFQLQLLWKKELIELIEKYSLKKSFKYKPKQIIWTYITENLEEQVIQQEVCSFLKSRLNWKEDLMSLRDDG